MEEFSFAFFGVDNSVAVPEQADDDEEDWESASDGSGEGEEPSSATEIITTTTTTTFAVPRLLTLAADYAARHSTRLHLTSLSPHLRILVLCHVRAMCSLMLFYEFIHQSKSNFNHD